MGTREKAFWQKVRKTNGCWLWTASKDKNGYGWFRYSHGYTAHRASWHFAYGEIPRGLCVCHKCDNPSCIRPDHLFLATNQENTADRQRKGRGNYAFGSSHYKAKLNEKIVAKIISSKLSNSDLGKKFGLPTKYVWQIRRGNVWKHVNTPNHIRTLR